MRLVGDGEEDVAGAGGNDELVADGLGGGDWLAPAARLLEALALVDGGPDLFDGDVGTPELGEGVAPGVATPQPANNSVPTIIADDIKVRCMTTVY